MKRDRKIRVFPEYLNRGSEGSGVAVLQWFLLGNGCLNVIPDGIYGHETAEAVKQLQRDLGVDPDGNFGPATKRAFMAQRGVDLGSFLKKPLIQKTTCAPESAGHEHV